MYSGDIYAGDIQLHHGAALHADREGHGGEQQNEVRRPVGVGVIRYHPASLPTNR